MCRARKGDGRFGSPAALHQCRLIRIEIRWIQDALQGRKEMLPFLHLARALPSSRKSNKKSVLRMANGNLTDHPRLLRLMAHTVVGVAKLSARAAVVQNLYQHEACWSGIVLRLYSLAAVYSKSYKRQRAVNNSQ